MYLYQFFMVTQSVPIKKYNQGASRLFSKTITVHCLILSIISDNFLNRSITV